jgi:hypothetical protein
MLVYTGTNDIWTGEPINNVRHPLNIEQLWTDAELNAIGLARVPPPVVSSVPQVVTRAQAKIAMLRAGILGAVEAAVDAAGGEAEIWYRDALTWSRDNPYINSLGAQLGLSQTQIDLLFIEAGGVNA